MSPRENCRPGSRSRFGAGDGLTADITDSSAIEHALAETESTLGPVDILVHAAAIGSGKFGFPYTNLSPEDWPRVLEWMSWGWSAWRMWWDRGCGIAGRGR